MRPLDFSRFRNVMAVALTAFAIAPLSGGLDAPAEALAAIRARTNLPPETDDPMRPANLRLLKPGVWTDDIGTDDLGNVYNQYRRSSVGTWSNYDETKASPFPLPDPIVRKNGETVKDAATWWQWRRPEILEDFFREIYGRIPPNTPAVTWEVTDVTELDGARTKTIVGHIDNSADPAVAPTIKLTLTIPVGALRAVPVLVAISPAPGGAPRRTPPAARDAAIPAGGDAKQGAIATSRIPNRPDPRHQALARGWGYATFDPLGVQADNSVGLTQGIIGLMNRGSSRTDAADWGALSAWAWGLSRAIDYFETDRDVDAKRLGVEGHSRWGKTALWAAAVDQRWAIVYASCSGEGGAKLSRRNFGETTDNIAGSHWMAGNFRKYGGHWDDLPVDAHELIALVAPRPVFVTGATQDPWSDPHGEFLALVGAGPVYRLLGKKDVGTTEMPAPDVSLISGDVAFREHIGAHTDLPDWPVFLDYAARYFTRPEEK